MRFSQQYCSGCRSSSLWPCFVGWVVSFTTHLKSEHQIPGKPEVLLTFLAFICYQVVFCWLFLCSNRIRCLQRGQKPCVLHSGPVFPDNSWKFVVACSKAKAVLASFCCPKNGSPFSVGLKGSPVPYARNLQRPARHLQNVRSPSM
jgi:hypothetical protein